MLSPSTKSNWETIQTYERKIQKIFINAPPYLRDPASCSSSTENLERAVLKLYSSYFLSELCRPVVGCTVDASDPLTACIRAKGLEHLISTINAFVELHTFNPHASRCRMAQQCAIISILLLAVTEDARSTPQFRSLLHNLKTIIKEHTSSENYFNYSTDSSFVSSCTRSTFTSLKDRNLLFSSSPSLDASHITFCQAASIAAGLAGVTFTCSPSSAAFFSGREFVGGPGHRLFFPSAEFLHAYNCSVSRSWWSTSETTVKVNDTVRSFRIQRLEILQHTKKFCYLFPYLV
jgi:hypothetical protein